MSIINLFKLHSALTPEQKQLLKTKQISGDYPLEFWLKHLAGVAQFDREAKSARKVFGTVQIVGIILTVFGGFALFLTPLWPLIPLFAIAGFGCLFGYLYFKSRTVPGNLRDSWFRCSPSCVKTPCRIP